MDTLHAGQQLNIGDTLVSANGRFTLWMQIDSNLVLYDGAPSPATAYWATNTEWLSVAQRPNRATVQTDGHFVLYDAGNAPRWASGTWGPDFADARLVLQDDGN